MRDIIPVYFPEEFSKEKSFVGKGQYGHVFSTYLDGKKVIHKISNGKPKGYEKEMFLHEMNMLKSISHSCIPKLIGYVREPLTIVMEYKNGENLADFISQKAPFENGMETIRNISMQIADILGYLHSKYILYRDLKPDNLLWDPHLKKISLVDFGLSIQLNKKDPFIRGGLVGTRGYLAPEIRKNKVYSFPVDVFSFGKTVYCFFIFPYYERNKTFPSQKEIDSFFWNLIQICCTNEPKLRPTIKQVYQSLQNWEELEEPSCWKRFRYYLKCF